MEPDVHGVRGDPWRDALDGLGLIQAAIIGSLVFGIIVRFVLGRAGLAGPILQMIVGLIFAIVLLAGLARWKNIPPETRARGLANLAHVGGWVNLVGSLLGVVMLMLALTGSLRGARALENWTVVLAVSNGFGALLYYVGFLLSARAVALYAEAKDVAGYATATLVTGLATIVVVLVGAVAASRRETTAIIILMAVLAIVSLVLFLVLLAGLKRCIRERPSPADAF